MNRILFTVFLFFCTFSLFGQTVKVVGISDGDSFTVLLPDNHTERVRLHGIDCPEYEQPFSKVATRFTSDHIFRKEVTLIPKDRDRYDRIIALVYLPDSTLLNTELL